MIEQKQLEGLTFRTAKRKEASEDGKKKVVNIPIERPLKVADILSETDHGSYTTIVTKDGRKYDIPAAKTKGGKSTEPPKGSDNTGSPEGGAGGGANP